MILPGTGRGTVRSTVDGAARYSLAQTQLRPADLSAGLPLVTRLEGKQSL